MFTLLAPTVEEYLPAAHGVHSVPEVLYVPASHTMHDVVPVCPSIHVQLMIPMLPAADVKFVGHGKQLVLDTTCNTLERPNQLLELEHHSCPSIRNAEDIPFQYTCAFVDDELTAVLSIKRGWVGFFHKKNPLVLCL